MEQRLVQRAMEPIAAGWGSLASARAVALRFAVRGVDEVSLPVRVRDRLQVSIPSLNVPGYDTGDRARM